MKNNRPLFLLSNDDGFQAKGLRELINVLQPVADLVVMAPDKGRSGMACSVTFDNPIRYTLVHQEEGLQIYSCSGTPVDCVKLAFSAILTQTPDLVICGINHGDNSAVNVHYSGTMGAVLEGCMKGISSIGFSLCNHNDDADFSPLFPYILRITEETLAHPLKSGVCLNVNFPSFPELKGVKICRQANGKWVNEWEPHEHPRGGSFYWLTGDFILKENSIDYDRFALEQGYVAITPINIDMTDEETMTALNNWNLNI